jgi:integrase
MPKVTKYPRLRTLTRRMKSGRQHTYYAYDMRPDGEKDIQLGKDFDAAIKRWDELHNKLPARAGTIEEAFAEWELKVLPTYTSAETRRGYAKGFRKLRPVFGPAGWAGVKMKHLVGYLEKRKGKTQANRELSLFQIVWNFARIRGMTELPWPAAGMERSKWKNPEKAREVEITDEVFNAIYAEGDQLLQDAMDLASATSMRITDVRTIPLPPTDLLRLKASKTGKKTDFDVSLSKVLPDLITRRRANKKAEHLMLLAGPFKRPVSYGMLNDRFTAARKAAATKARERGEQDLAASIAAMWQRDCRKYAADLADTSDDAQALLQHGSKATTMRHYRTRADQVKPVR